MRKKTILKLFLVFFATSIMAISMIVIANGSKKQSTNNVTMARTIDTSTNFFTTAINKSKVDEVNDDSELLDNGYRFIGENNRLGLYLDEKTMGIAIYDYNAKYIWYSCYKKYKTSLIDESQEFNETNQQSISSGVIITSYETTNLYETTKYSASSKDCSIKYKFESLGFIATLKFITLGTTFDIHVYIDGNDLKVEVLLDTLTEEPYKAKGKKVATNYKLKSIEVFPYFGSERYDINAYAFIPDGSGALIRYENVSYDTAYIKKVYGEDYGNKNDITSEYLKNQNYITLPIFGINHGYKQASFLVEVKDGFGSCELHSYPYDYSNIKLNRTFFSFVAREKLNINMASSETGKITIINSDMASSKYSLDYTFLAGDDAGYVGMAKEYEKEFNFRNQSLNDKATLKLDVVAQDYKEGLFGKNYIRMTSYKDLLLILDELKNLGIKKFEINYIGYNKNGFFDNTLSKIKLDTRLGSKKDYFALMKFAEESNVTFYYYSNPIVATKNAISKKTIKRSNLEIFEYKFKSSLDLDGRIIAPTALSEYFLKYQKTYKKLNMNNFCFDYLGSAAFSYRYKYNNYTRDDMISQIRSETEKISKNNYGISLYKPNNYLYDYITSYYDADYESSKYSFITDSIPFISLVLSGHVNMYSTNINYISDYDLYALRMIEYGISPSYVITKNPTSNLRYCNYEYLFTTEYELWKNNIINEYQKIAEAFDAISTSKMIDHDVVENGIIKCSYNNGVVIIINYLENDYNYSGKVVKSMSYRVFGGDD